MGAFVKDCWFLTGTTATGKSDVGLLLAERLGCEIVALDSMTIYRGMDIGTAKPSAADRARVPHHLLDALDPSESGTIDWYLKQAERVSGEIRSRGKQPLFVGGTPLYLKALLRGLFDGPPAQPELRSAWEAQADREGEEALHRQLRAVDPAAASRIAVGDRRRIVRALEVHAVTGTPISDWQKQFATKLEPPPRVACLMRPRDETNARINERVPKMLAAGWIEETRRLWAGDPPPSRQAAQAVGYSEILEHLGGRLDYGAMVELIQTRTRQFCKRQRTWFRHLEECQWMDTDASEPIERLADRLDAFFRTPASDSIRGGS